MEGGAATAARVEGIGGREGSGRSEEGVMGQLLSAINKKSLQIFVKKTVCGGPHAVVYQTDGAQRGRCRR